MLKMNSNKITALPTAETQTAQSRVALATGGQQLTDVEVESTFDRILRKSIRIEIPWASITRSVLGR